MGNDNLKNRLKEIGEKESGKDFFVHIGKIGGNDYDKMVTDFKIRQLPVIIITGKDTVATLRSQTSDSDDLTAYVRLDNEYLLKNIERTMGAVGEIVNLFVD